MRQKLLSMNPVLGAVLFAAVLLVGRLALNWFISKANPHLRFWSALSQVLGPVVGTVVASIVVYLLLRTLARQHMLLGMLNHELRNALQVIAYLVPHSEDVYREAAQGAVERMKKIVREISEQLG
jgi:hypothetical protein